MQRVEIAAPTLRPAGVKPFGLVEPTLPVQRRTSESIDANGTGFSGLATVRRGAYAAHAGIRSEHRRIANAAAPRTERPPPAGVVVIAGGAANTAFVPAQPTTPVAASCFSILPTS
jgi:hypothetical protein